MQPFSERPNVALAVYAHPDDADVAAGGVLALWAAAGTATHLLIVCDGSKGSHDATVSSGDLRRDRGRELAEAARILGVRSVTTLERLDGEFSNDVSLREELVRHIRRLRPDVVFAPDPTATFFGGVYVNHRDHRETGWALLDAVAPASAMPLYFTGAGPAHSVTHLLLSGTHEPDVVVDVSAAIEKKIAAVLAHGSQLAESPEWVRQIVLSRSEQAGRELGVAHGEAFRHVALSH